MDSTGTSTRISNARPDGLSRDVLATMRGRLAMVHARLGTRGLILVAALAVAAIGYSSWGWLVAIGLAPIILGVLPCAGMCAMGLCMMPKRSAPAATSAPTDDQPATAANTLDAAEATPGTLTTGKENKSCC